MSIARFIDNALLSITEFFNGPSNTFCRLETACDDHTLVADDGTLISFIDLKGCLQMMGPAEFDYAVKNLEASCTGYLKKRGHSLQFVIHRDPDTVREEIDQNFDLMKNTARAMGMDIDSIMDSNASMLERYTASEHCWVVVWTYPYALPPKTRSQASKLAEQTNVPPANAQTMRLNTMDVLLKAHRSFTQACVSAFAKARLWASLMDAHDALWWIRKGVDPEWTSRHWRAVLPGDRIPLREAEAGDPPITGAQYIKAKHQVFPRAAVTDGETVRIGNFLHRPFTMEMAPQQPQAFAEIFRELVKNPFGWRMSFHVSGDGLRGTGLKATLAQIFSFTNSENKMLLQAIRGLEELKTEDGHAIVRFEANFDTWVDTKHFSSEKDARDELEVNLNHFVAALQSWGSMEVREIIGDPLLPFSATLPGFALKTPSAKAAAPFIETLSMMPLARPASPWNQGSLLLRTTDGKLFPVMPMSGEQAAWIEMGFGGLGSGKSFWINCTNWAFLFMPGLDELPNLGIIDIGPSSSGLIRLLEHSLPPHQRKYVATHKLFMSPEYAINPFDTPLGCRKPFESQVQWLVSLLSGLCTPDDKETPPEGVAGLLRACIDRAYENFGHKKARLYQSNLSPEVDEKIKHLDLAIDPHTTWWELVDAFFLEGMTHEATLAQRFAMPLLTDVSALTRDKGFESAYGENNRVPSGEMLTEYVARKLSEASTSYPIFAYPTKFDLGEARIVSLDLEDVAPKGSSAANRQTGIMYLLAMQLVSGRYFYTQNDAEMIQVPGDEEMTQKYREYHQAGIKKMRQLPKRIVLDEFHRATQSGSIVKQVVQRIETITRESRKNLISIGLYSQKIEDMPKAISDLATTHYILGADSPEVQRHLIERYDLNSAGRNALRQLRKPNASGSTCLQISIVKDGYSVHLLMNTAGPQHLWAFSTNRKDMEVRDELYREIGVVDALETLVEQHPGGVEDYIQDKRNENAARGIRSDAIADTVQELIKASRRKKHAA